MSTMEHVSRKADRFKVKVELHVHLDGSIRPQTVLDIAKKRGIDVGVENVDEIKKRIVCSEPPWGLNILLEKFHFFMPVIAGCRDAVYRMAYEFCEDCASHGTKYCEARYSPHLLANSLDTPPYAHERGNFTPADVVETVNQGFRDGKRDFNVNVKSILCCIVHYPEWSSDVVELCSKYKSDGVVGIDIACGDLDPGKEPNECLHKQAFQEAFRQGIRRTVHAGESGPAEGVREAIDDMHAERIGHGYHVMDDEDLYHRLRKTDVHFEVCPLSSVRTGAVTDDLAQHPLHRFIDDGVNFSINSDDPIVLDNDLSTDYDMVMEMGMTEDQIIKCIFNAAKSCFAPENEKQELLKILVNEYGDH